MSQVLTIYFPPIHKRVIGEQASFWQIAFAGHVIRPSLLNMQWTGNPRVVAYFKITLMRKKGSLQMIENFWPVTGLCSTSSTFESLIQNWNFLLREKFIVEFTSAEAPLNKWTFTYCFWHLDPHMYCLFFCIFYFFSF